MGVNTELGQTMVRQFRPPDSGEHRFAPASLFEAVDPVDGPRVDFPQIPLLKTFQKI
jgi:hypothetical protein